MYRAVIQDRTGRVLVTDFPRMYLLEAQRRAVGHVVGLSRAPGPSLLVSVQSFERGAWSDLQTVTVPAREA